MTEDIETLVRRRFGNAVDVGPETAAGETVRGILSRRSCRKYRQEPLAPGLLRLLLASAMSAPSKSDLQQVSVIHVSDREKQGRIAALSPDTAWAAAAPLFLVWCGDSRRIRRVSRWRDHDFANDHLDAFFNAAVDTGIAMQTFIIAAESMGLGCCPLSQVRDNIRQLSAELELPQWVFPVAGLCVGWPDGESHTSMRLPLEVTVHENRYDDASLQQQVATYDRRREEAEPTAVSQQRMRDRFGISDDYGWSENRSRQYAVAARQDFGEYIRAQGFNLE
jgi:nitroreductase/FMN reductase [NAD(P)H]